MVRNRLFPRQFTPGWIFAFFGRIGIIFILLFNSHFLSNQIGSYFLPNDLSFNQPKNQNTLANSNSLPSYASIPSVTCDPLQVTSNGDNGNECGTLRYAINFLTSNPANPIKIINLTLAPGSEIIPSSGFVLPAGVSLAANCSVTGATVRIIGNDSNGVGLTLSGSNIITGVQVGGFKGTQVKTTGTGNKLSCTKVSTILSATGVTLPPDPGQVAPPVDPSTATDVGTSTAFLYTGSNPIQTGVVSGTITKTRAAVLRGKLLDRQNQPVGGVIVQILNHLEYGQTLSRADGMFDMAVNGGDSLIINYTKDGYLAVQRTVNVPWQDFENVEDVVLTQLDPVKTDVNLATMSGMTVVRGSQITDGDGTRRATLLVPPGTTATMTLSGGVTQTITNLSIRATEYTTGDTGTSAMPGTLPANSGYTYATEWSIDQAQAAGALRVDFNQPLVQYLDNFLNFSVGQPVPAGYYDRIKGIWVADKNGRVVKILSISGDLANLDTNGDNVVDNGTDLSPVITTAERQQLALLYSSGQTFWRVPLLHFSAWDFNWPFGFPDDAEVSDAPEATPETDDPDDPCTTEASSLIECQDQILRESLPVNGTAFTLNYSSGRVTGRKTAYNIKIPQTGATVPASVKRIEQEIYVAGQVFTSTLATITPNQQTTFTWNGKDAYGRIVQGKQKVKVRIGYVYDGVYLTPSDQPGADYDALFGHFSYFGTQATGDRTRQEVTLWREENLQAGGWDNRSFGLGGWDLNVHNFYDPGTQTIYMGNGSRRSTNFLNSDVITTTAGNGTPGYSGDNGKASAATIYHPDQLKVAPDGSIYFDEQENHVIRRISPAGIISTVAGNGVSGDSADGIPATQASLNGLGGVAIGPDGSFYLSDGNRIRKVAPSGIITTIAGSTDVGFSGDGGPATAAQFAAPCGLIVGSDGSIYIADLSNGRVRRIGPDGIITTIAGGGNPGDGFGDGGPATQAALNWPSAVALDQHGNLFIADSLNNRIRKVGTDGIITTVAGTEFPGFSGDGGLAISAQLFRPDGISIGPDDSLYIADWINHRVRKVSTNGIITTVAGSGEAGFTGDGGVSTQADLFSPTDVAISPNGDLFIAELDGNRIRKISASMPGLSVGIMAVSSQSGNQLYIFDSAGKHLQTKDTLTGAILYQFGYDSAGRLASVTDLNNQTTAINYDPTGKPTGITGPYGQTTALTTNANGFLASVANPAGETYSLGYTNGGLLTSMTDPRQKTATMTYDPNSGLLTKDQNAAGGFFSISKVENSTSYSTTLTSAEGRPTTYSIGKSLTGTENRTNTAPTSLKYQASKGTDGSRSSTSPNGSTTTSVLGPDPRFGMQAPLTSSTVYTAAPGLVANKTTTRSVTLSNPDDPFSLSSKTDTVTINNRAFTQSYNAANKTFTTNTPENRQTTTTIDAKGRLISNQVTSLDPITYTYDAQGRLSTLTGSSGVNARSSSLSYFSSGASKGYLQTVTNPLLQQVSFAYDNAGRVTSQTLPGNRTVAYTYDVKGNLTSLTPPGKGAHTFTYNNVDLPLTYTAPAVTGGGTNQTVYAYNLDKQLTGITSPDSSSTSLGYDSAGRLASITTPNRTVNYTYDPTTGQLTTTNVAGSGGPGLTYNYNGVLLAGETYTGPVPGSISQTYNNNLWVSSESVNSGNTINFSYDNDGLITSAGDLALYRDPQNGLVTASSLGGLNTSLTYNSFGELISYTATQDSNLVFSDTFNRDKLGRIMQKVESIGGSSATYIYSYDDAGRLSGVQKNGISIAAYTYDANGNRLTGPGGESGTYDAQDRLLTYGANSYSYNARGDLASKTNGGQTTTYQYDLESNLLGATLPNSTQVSYIVDGNNRRIGKKVNGTLVQGFLYKDGLRPLAELNGAGNIVSRFVYATDSNVPSYMIKGGVIYRFITDQVGSVRLVMNISNGTIAERMDYDEFGNVLSDSAPGFQPFGFAGGIYDQNTKLTRFGARDYDSVSGRFVSKDKLKFIGGSNLYSYALNNPLNLKDPSGLICDDEDDDFDQDFDDMGDLQDSSDTDFDGFLDKLKDAFDKLKDAKDDFEDAYEAFKAIPEVAEATTGGELLDAIGLGFENALPALEALATGAEAIGLETVAASLATVGATIGGVAIAPAVLGVVTTGLVLYGGYKLFSGSLNTVEAIRGTSN